MWPIFSINFQQKSVYIYHWFQQKPQNSEKNQPLRASPTNSQFPPQTFSRKVCIFIIDYSKNPKTTKNPTSQSLSDKQLISTKNSQQKIVGYTMWGHRKLNFLSKNKGNTMCPTLFSLPLGNILCMSHSYAVRTEKLKFMSKNKGNITCCVRCYYLYA